MTKITPTDRERLKSNIRFTKQAGHNKMALDLAFHVYFADTLNYIKQSEELDKPKKQI